jgi:excisionase family DNA binding protein
MVAITKDLLSISELILKVSLSKSTVYRMLNSGTLKGVKIGKKWFIEISEFERLIKNSGGDLNE